MAEQKQEQREQLKEHIPAPHRGADNPRDMAEMERMRREDPLFLEKTRAEDASGIPGQRTRDNVNPNIPSAEPGKGGIVDPTSLGMEQGGVPANMPSINEPPGSQVGATEAERKAAEAATRPQQAGQQPAPAPDDKEDEREELPSPAELEKMTRAELDELAEERDVDVSDAGNKQDVIDALRKDARKRKRS